MSELLQETAGFVRDKLNIKSNESILLAVSGGIDSMVMCDIMRKLNLDLAIAHCNFSLRAEESDGDEQFVRDYAEACSIRFYSKKFNTLEYGRINGLSVQMAARELRYNWFEELRESESYNFIAIAHNSDDIKETFFINLARGTGLKGLSGIKARKGNIIRPVLHASRAQIVQYAKLNDLKYREDSSNSTIYYKRNRLRHKIIPEFRHLNPSFDLTICSTIQKLSETYKLLEEYIASVKNRLFSEENGITSVSVNELAKLSPANTWLFELFKEFSVNEGQLNEIKKLLYAESGRKLVTSSHLILKDRGSLLISPNTEVVDQTIILSSLDELFAYPGFSCDAVAIEEFEMIRDKAVACLDLETLEFPLTIRSWEAGDWFYPLGMKGKKKISDFFTDSKIPLSLKSSKKLLLSSDKICWIAGYRTDNRFKIKESTKTVLIIRINPSL